MDRPKSNNGFGLENAQWPSLLVEEGGVIRRVNEAARDVFGAVVQEDTSLLSAIWAAGNEMTAQLFLIRPPLGPQTLKLRVRSGSEQLFQVHLCSTAPDGQRVFLFQFFPAAMEPAPKPAPAPAPAAPAVDPAVAAQKQKLDCAVQLARSVSNDFNNALTSILGHTSLLLQQTDEGNPSISGLREIEKSASRAVEISRDLATFSRQDREPAGQTVGNINDVLTRAVEMFKKTDTNEINWEVSLEKRPFAASFDEAKLQQALSRIIENAMDAVQPKGWIGVQARNVDIPEATQDRSVRLERGNYLCIDIADNGTGIEAANLARAFEPFFSTKPGRRGLGLALVYGIVTNHGGGVTISSEPNQGTSVRIYLPALRRLARVANDESPDLHGTGSILVVDDEDLILKLSQAVLGSYGYTVTTVNSGQKAVDFLTETGTRVDLIITDLVMPQMSGRELMDRLEWLAPGVPVICSSGNVRSEGRDEEMYLQKPFTTQDLLRKVKSTMALALHNEPA